MATKEYSNGEVTIIWKPDLCIHSANCVGGLPNVFKPEEKPWITPEGATTDQIVSQVKQCPSGALSYYMNDGIKEENSMTSESKIQVAENGPLIVNGDCEVTHKDGTVEKRSKMTAFCRCGGSSNKPYCDGTHKKIDFQG